MVPLKNSLYLGTDDEVIRLPAQRCRRFSTQAQCLNAMDPYCGWLDAQKECTPPPNKNPLVSYWQQSITSCPVVDAPSTYRFRPLRIASNPRTEMQVICVYVVDVRVIGLNTRFFHEGTNVRSDLMIWNALSLTLNCDFVKKRIHQMVVLI